MSDPGRMFYKYCDTISVKQFHKVVKYYLKKMRIGVNVSVPEMIDIIKIYNTKPERKNAKFRKFETLYQVQYMGKACDMLNCVGLKGLVLYSKEYELYLTSGGKEMPCYNYFHLK